MLPVVGYGYFLESHNTHEICDNLCFLFPVLSLVSLMHVRLATSAQRMSGLHNHVSCH